MRERFPETIPIDPSIELAVDAWLEKSGHLFEVRDVFFSEWQDVFQASQLISFVEVGSSMDLLGISLKDMGTDVRQRIE